MTKEEADALHHEYGSTIEGLKQNAIASNATTPAEVKQLLMDYYDQVWSDLDYSSLLTHDASSSTTQKEETGYNHFVPSVSLFNFLRTCPVPIHLASNSPSWHIRKITEALGLCQLFPDAVTSTVTTPDTVVSKAAATAETADNDDITLFLPTKASPEIFYDNIRRAHPIQKLVLLDDSKIHIEKACWHGIEGIQVQNGQIQEAIGRAIGHIDREYTLSVPDYLKAKNEDRRQVQ
jgi:beta-phosphoglucomutase-like phosphatase (HAD superfamily)